MHFDKFIRPFVGADLSRPPPIYRPVMPDDAHGRIAYATSIIGPPTHWQSLPLYRRVTCFAVEVIQVFGLNEIKAGFINALQQSDDLRMADLRPAI
jgi:hypothetical protein